MMQASRLVCVFVFTFFACFSSLAVAERKNWVLLVAGSGSYDNYRHQADVCHAYQIVHKNGIPDEQVVVMMKDDIADNFCNPVPGNIINRPGGPNVYPGVPKDYTGREVTAKTFLQVLQGDADGIENRLGRRGKVINSGPEDYVFVNYADHGGPGTVGMPYGNALTAKSLVEALKKMHAQKKFAKLVFYMEACESGSMFEDLLPDDIDLYVTTAANAEESSYACYCDSDRGTCLGDTYSVCWMENSDATDIRNETLQQQYQYVKNRTAHYTYPSHVMQYGDTSFTSLTVNQFIANGTTGVNPHRKQQQWQTLAASPRNEIPADMVGIHTLKRLLVSPHPRHVARRAEIARDLQAELWTRDQTVQLLTDVARRAFPEQDITWAVERRGARIQDWDCYERALDRLMELCPGMQPGDNNFSLRRMNVLVNLCNSRPDEIVTSAIEGAIAAHPICYK